MIIFPLEFNDEGNIPGYDLEQQIKSGIVLSLTTPLGSRIGFPEFGSELHLIPFKNGDINAINLAKMYIEDALTKDVPEIEVTDIVFYFKKNTSQKNGNKEDIYANIYYINLIETMSTYVEVLLN